MTDTLASQLADFRSKTSQTLVDLGKPDPEKLQKLQALGYVGSDTAPVQDEKILTGADPKTRIEIANLLHDAMFDVEDARYEQAIPLLQRALAVQPEMPVANLQYGIAQARLKHFDLAIAPLRKAVTAQPDNGMGHYELGLALFETGDWKGAAPEFEASAERAPRWADAHFSLAAVYARIDRVPEAMTELDTTLGLSPDHYRANLLRGRILSCRATRWARSTTWKKRPGSSPIPGKPISSWPMPTSNSAAWPMRSGSGPPPGSWQVHSTETTWGQPPPAVRSSRARRGTAWKGTAVVQAGTRSTAWKGTTVAQAGTRSTAWKGTTSVVPHRAEASAALAAGVCFSPTVQADPQRAFPCASSQPQALKRGQIFATYWHD